MKAIRVCSRCGHVVEVETHKDIDYPYYCPNCDENMYEIETELIGNKNPIHNVIVASLNFDGGGCDCICHSNKSLDNFIQECTEEIKKAKIKAEIVIHLYDRLKYPKGTFSKKDDNNVSFFDNYFNMDENVVKRYDLDFA